MDVVSLFFYFLHKTMKYVCYIIWFYGTLLLYHENNFHFVIFFLVQSRQVTVLKFVNYSLKYLKFLIFMIKISLLIIWRLRIFYLMIVYSKDNLFYIMLRVCLSAVTDSIRHVLPISRSEWLFRKQLGIIQKV